MYLHLNRIKSFGDIDYESTELTPSSQSVCCMFCLKMTVLIIIFKVKYQPAQPRIDWLLGSLLERPNGQSVPGLAWVSEGGLSWYGTETVGLGTPSGSQFEVQTWLLSSWSREGEPLKQGRKEEEQLHPGQLFS